MVGGECLIARHQAMPYAKPYERMVDLLARSGQALSVHRRLLSLHPAKMLMAVVVVVAVAVVVIVVVVVRMLMGVVVLQAGFCQYLWAGLSVHRANECGKGPLSRRRAFVRGGLGPSDPLRWDTCTVLEPPFVYLNVDGIGGVAGVHILGPQVHLTESYPVQVLLPRVWHTERKERRVLEGATMPALRF